jgi:hypothetical protein
MRVDDGVSDLELDALDLALDLEVFEELFFFSDVGDGVPPSGYGGGGEAQVCR